MDYIAEANRFMYDDNYIVESAATDLQSVLKKHGYRMISMTVDSYKSKTIQGAGKGIPGGSIGPMTVTNAHMERNAKIEKDLRNDIYNLNKEYFDIPSEILVKVKQSSGFSDPIILKIGNNKYKAISMVWNLYPAYVRSAGLSSDYQNYWLQINTKDITVK